MDTPAWRRVLPLPAPFLRLLLTAALALTSARCSEGPTGLDTTPTSLTIVSGNGQENLVGTQLPNLLRVQVRNRSGFGIDGVIVDWVISDSAGPGASLGSASSVTDASGTAENVLTLGSVDGAYQVTATVSGLAKAPAVFTATALPHLVVVITSGPTDPRQGDVVTYTAEARDEDGNKVDGVRIAWQITPAAAGLILPDGRFVGYTPGPAAVVASAFGLSHDTIAISIGQRGLSGSFGVVGRGEVGDRYTSDLWAGGNYVYTGTWGCRFAGCSGDRVLAWDVSDPANPVLTDSVVVEAQTVNDVKIRADGAIGVVTHEGCFGERPDVTLLDLRDPAHPSPITSFNSGVPSGLAACGVHNVWVEGNYLYVVRDHFTAGEGQGPLAVFDISMPEVPSLVATFNGGSSFLHDVYVRDGLAFLSHWNAGLIILDVGNGISGGAPMNPAEVGRVLTDGGQTHNAWYWPATGYVFVGEEDFATPGMVHVVDARDLTTPTEVASFRVSGATPHNFWLDETRAILYVGWYEQGVRAIDVSGVLLGRLDLQGREIASIVYDGAGPCPGSGTCTWAPQLHKGLIFASDMNSGLWVLEVLF